jgi:lambda family phage portal protein
MVREVAILGPDGTPVKPAQSAARARALAGGQGNYGGPPYDAADLYGQHMAAWTPMLWSPDGELNMYRDRIVSRVRDMVRNDGWASGAVTRILDNAVGANMRPICKPDYRFLAAATGIKGFDHEWAKEFGRAGDANWRGWAEDDLGRYCDAARKMTFGQMLRVAFRHKLVDGDAIAILPWLDDRVGYGRARYATAVQLIDPDRLSNPQMRFDQNSSRGGVEIDPETGAAVGYWFRKAHAGDWWSASQSMTWELVPRETDWGRPIVVHDFDADRASTHRGGAGIFAPVLQRLKMLVKYDGVELDAAIINAIFAAYVESPFDHELVGEALSEGGEKSLGIYQAGRADFHKEKNLLLGSSRIPMLFPGEKISTVNATRPASNFKDFEGAVLRNVATGLGLSAQQVSNDWSDVNYSSARAALLEAWKTLTRRRADFAAGFAAPIRAAWLEEAMELDDLPLPAGAPAFAAFRAAYSRARWLGPPLGWVDPVDERVGAVIGMDAGFQTLEDICAEQGQDMEEVLEQRAYEIKKFDELGIPRPEWTGAIAVDRIKQPPQQPQPK